MRAPLTTDVLALLCSTFLVPSISVGILHRGQRLLLNSGQAQLEPPIPLDDQTAFPMGSITKTFTATLCLMLSERGLLDLDEPVQSLLPDLRIADPDVARALTVRHLLTHTTGFEPPRLSPPGADTDLAACVAALPPLRQAAPLGTFQYLDAAYILAGRIIEIVTGQAYEEVARAWMLRPLGLHSARFSHEPAIAGVHDAVGYIKAPGGALHPYAGTTYGPYLAPTGGLFLTPADVLTYLAFVLAEGQTQTRHSLLDPRSFRQLIRPADHGSSAGTAVMQRGLAWETVRAGDAHVHLQRCSLLGINGVALVIPEQELAAVIFNNAFHGLRPQVQLMEMILGAPK